MLLKASSPIIFNPSGNSIFDNEWALAKAFGAISIIPSGTLKLINFFFSPTYLINIVPVSSVRISESLFEDDTFPIIFFVFSTGYGASYFV